VIHHRPHPHATLVIAAAFAALAVCLAVPAPRTLAAGIVQSPADERSYESFVLANGLRVLLVSDPATDKAAASLDVNVGNGSDPEDRPGLAHFLEHMLFLGTEKYPEPGEYQRFISAHGGGHNAYTAYEHTNYFFEVDAAFLEPALDRFAQFFVAPLFSPEYVEREKNAVHSEYRARIRSDGRRAFEARQQAMNPEHPMASFAVGSLETLADREDATVRDELLRFYRRHYSADLMTLAVVGKEPLDRLRRWVSERFAAVPDRDAQPLAVDVPLYLPETLPARLAVEPIKERRALSLEFPVPPLGPHWRAKPVRYVAHLLGHEGEGSLLSALKRRGWAEGLSAGPGVDVRDHATLQVSIRLTREGLQRVDEIADLVFDAVRLIEREGVQEWIFEEQRRLAEIDFRFAERMDASSYARTLAARMHEYPIEDVLRGPYAMDHYDPALIRDYLARLRPENALITLMAEDVQTDRVTEWYQTPYRLEPLAPDTARAWAGGGVDPALALPARNPFIPERVAVKEPRDPSPKPRRIREAEGFELWHRHDVEFGVPRAEFYFSLRSPSANDTPRHDVLTDLFVRTVNDRLNEFAYPASLAGLDYRLYDHIRGVTVRISGYDDKQRLLLERIARTLREVEVDDGRFAIFKEELMRALRNTAEETPYRQTAREIGNLLLVPHWTEAQRLAALEPLRPADLRAFIPELLGRLEIVALAHGNLRRDEALALGRVLESGLLAHAEPMKVAGGEVVKLVPGERVYRGLDVDHTDSAITLYVQGRDRRDATRGRHAFIAQLLGPRFYHELRTEQQLGYIVYAGRRSLLHLPGLQMTIQSPVADPIELETRIERFLGAFAERLESMEPAELERERESLLARILEADERLAERADRYWSEIDREELGFDSRERLAQAVRAIEPRALAAFYREALLGEGRRTLVVRATGEAHEAAFAEKRQDRAERVIRDPQAFKQAMEHLPWLQVSRGAPGSARAPADAAYAHSASVQAVSMRAADTASRSAE